MSKFFKTKLVFIGSKNSANYNLLQSYNDDSVKFLHMESLQQDFLNSIKKSQIIYLVLESEKDENIKIAQSVLKQAKAQNILIITISSKDSLKINKTAEEWYAQTDLFLRLKNKEIIKCINLINNSICKPGLINIDFKDIENMIKDSTASKKGIFNFIELMPTDGVEKVSKDVSKKISNKNFCIMSINMSIDTSSITEFSKIENILIKISSKFKPEMQIIASVFNDITSETLEISILAF